MPELPSNKQLDNAINKAEVDRTAIKKDIEKHTSTTSPKKVTTTKTIKRGNKTLKSQTTKAATKTPDDFKDHPLAKSINNVVSKLAKIDNLGSDCDFGESVALTIDFYMDDIPNHPLMFLALSCGMMGFKIAEEKGMLKETMDKIGLGENNAVHK